LRLSEVELRDAASPAEFGQRIAAFHQKFPRDAAARRYVDQIPLGSPRRGSSTSLSRNPEPEHGNAIVKTAQPERRGHR